MQNSFNPVQILLSLHAQGRFAEMEQRARELLRGNGNVPILNELLGISLTGQKKFSDALPFLQKAVRREPNDALFWENLALCQRELGEYTHAEKSLRQSLKIRPTNAEAWNALGSVLRSQERTDEARAAFEQAIAIAPNHAAAHFNLGKLNLTQKKWKEAETALNRAIRCGLSDAIGHQFLGRILLMRERYAEAARHFRSAIERNPADYLNFFCLASVERKLGRKIQAESMVNAAFGRLGNIGSKLTADTINDFDYVVGLLIEMDLHFDALRILKVTVPFDNHCGRAAMAAAAARNICDWDLAACFERIVIDLFHSRHEPVNPFASLSFANGTAALQLEVARRWSCECPPMTHIEKPALVTSSNRKIRVAYVSSDFYSHATAILLAGVIEKHDRERFEIFGYDHSAVACDSYRTRLVNAFERFNQLDRDSDDRAAQSIGKDQIDIVVDLKGWTRNSLSHILAARPARLQVQWLGFPGTVGAPWIDYIVADRRLIRPGEEPCYSERVLALPDSYQPSDDKRELPAPTSRRACGLPEGAFVFGCFNQSYKITLEMFDIWMRLLLAKDNAILWLLDWNSHATAALRKAAAARGLPKDRIMFAPIVSATDHLSRVQIIDVALDCFPVNSHTTASDMLWAGVPMVGLSGETFASRVSESILCAAGLPDLVTRSYDDYFNLALQLASDPQKLAAIRARVRNCKTSALFDTKRFTRSLERGFELIWERHLQGLPPDHIDVPPVQ